MAALRYLHLCQFQFADQDIRVVGTELDGGTSLSGISEPIQIDGGGYWQADFSNADFGGPGEDDRAATLAWRSLNAGLAGGAQAVLYFCDRHHQPVRSIHSWSGDPGYIPNQLSDQAASSQVLAVRNGQTGGLNCTILDISLLSERPLIGGERFTYVHPTWGDRCAEISSVQELGVGEYRISFHPPVRGGIAVGDALDFENPRCVVRRASAPSNQLNMGLWSSASITFVEDMRKPVA